MPRAMKRKPVKPRGKKRGPKEEYLKLNGNWKDAIAKSFQKKIK